MILIICGETDDDDDGKYVPSTDDPQEKGEIIILS